MTHAPIAAAVSTIPTNDGPPLQAASSNKVGASTVTPSRRRETDPNIRCTRRQSPLACLVCISCTCLNQRPHIVSKVGISTPRFLAALDIYRPALPSTASFLLTLNNLNCIATLQHFEISIWPLQLPTTPPTAARTVISSETTTMTATPHRRTPSIPPAMVFQCHTRTRHRESVRTDLCSSRTSTW